MRDHDVRPALVEALRAACPDSLIIEELDILRINRVDVAIIDTHLHGYEIKADNDTLDRLHDQVNAYGLVFQRMTLVAGPKHVKKAAKVVPDWWGIIVADFKGESMRLNCARVGTDNPAVDGQHLAGLLWRKELTEGLIARGVKRGLSNVNFQLAAMLAERMPMDELVAYVAGKLYARGDWRTNGVGRFQREKKEKKIASGSRWGIQTPP